MVSTGSTTGGSLTRAEIEEFWAGWLQGNRDVEETGDWRPLAEFYATDANYGWMYHPDEHFMAVGRDQIRDWAIGIEMDGLDGWHYDYVCTMIDETKNMVLGFWQQKSGIVNDETGEEYEIRGIGGSWFGLKRVTEGADAGQVKIDWQRDWFDLPSTTHTFIEILKSGKAPDTLLKRMEVGAKGMELPGHYRYADMTSTLWPPPVAAGQYVTQQASSSLVEPVETGSTSGGSTGEVEATA